MIKQPQTPMKYLVATAIFTFLYSTTIFAQSGPEAPPSAPAAPIDDYFFTLLCAAAITVFVFFYIKNKTNQMQSN